MVFSDLFFLFVFIPAFTILYLLATWIDKKATHNFTLRNITLVIFSLLFYAWGEPVYVFLMLVAVVINYFAGLAIASGGRWSKLWLGVGVTLDLAIMGTFKYLGFFADTLAHFGIETKAPHLALPIGISFYIFQSISYLVDVYRKEAHVQRNIFDLLLYIAMFPQLIAGPIVRYGSVAREIHDRRVTADDMAEGMYRFLIGLAKKVILANMLSEIAEKFLVNGLSELSTAGAWIGIIAFTMQIYFDFSGYSDMAIGLGRCLGFHFGENFNNPYCCRSVTDFWRRWHISLGSFFRDYVYIPLGGNRRHQMLNLLTVWFLTGMWHGASWNFIIWGLYFGLILVIEKYTLLRWKWIPGWFMRIFSLLVAIAGWGIFYFDDFSKMQTFFASFFGNATASWSYIEEGALLDNFWLWIAAILFCLPLGRLPLLRHLAPTYKSTSAPAQAIGTTLRIGISAALLILCVALLVGATNNAFIYTRF